MAAELSKRLSPQVMKGVRIYLNDPMPKDLDPQKVNILWNQHNHNQPVIKKAFGEGLVNRFDCIVYVSNWQYDRYRNVYRVSPEQSAVLMNAIDMDLGLEKKESSGDVLRLIYTSTPFRGLDVLLDAFDLVQDLPVELEIFSSTQIYGKAFHDSEQHKYEPLFERARRHPRIHYQGFAENKVVRQAVLNADIFAYPCTFEETSCIAAIEAGFSGLDLCVTNLGALFETCSAFGTYTPYEFDGPRLAQRFAQSLRTAVESYNREEAKRRRSLQTSYFKRFYDWNSRAQEWTILLTRLKREKGLS
jgi:glycosyltransferase involved in cell wall biosynthesis